MGEDIKKSNIETEELGFIKKVNAVFLNIENIQKSVELFSSEAIAILDKVSRDDIVELKALSFCLDELNEIYNNLNFILQSKEFVKDMAAYEVFVEDKLEIMEQKEKLVKDLSVNVEQTYQLVESKKDELIGIIYSVVQNTRTTLNLDNVDNTADINKPVSIATQEELDKKIDITNIEDSFSCDDKAKVLSAKCGKELKDLIEDINTILLCDDKTLDSLQKIANFIKENKTSIQNIEEALDKKLEQNSNIQSASKLETPRTISLSGAVSGKAVFDGSSDITIETTSLSSIGSYALVTINPIAVWKERRFPYKSGYVYTTVSKTNENVAGSELIEVSFSNTAQSMEYISDRNMGQKQTFSTNSTNFIPTKRVLSGTWALQGTAEGRSDGHTCCLAVRVA